MPSDTKIEIKVKQTFDESSAASTSERVRSTAEQNAAAITAAEEAESQKRIAIIEEEAQAKQQALNSVTPPPESPSAGSAPLASGAVERLTQVLHTLQEEMRRYQEEARTCLDATDDIRHAMEDMADAAGTSRDTVDAFGADIEQLVARQEDLHMAARDVAVAAQALEQRLQAGTISSERAKVVCEELSKRYGDIVAAMKELRQESLTLQQDMQASIPLIIRQGEARRAAMEGASKATSKLGILTKDVTGSIANGFNAAARVVGKFRSIVGKATFAMAVINQAWEFASKVWDVLKNKSEAATKAVEEHKEKLQELFAESDRLMQEQMAATRKNKADEVYKIMEAGIARVNKELERGLKLKKRDLELELRRKKLNMSREAQKLEDEEFALDERIEAGGIEEWQAADLRADIERRRAQLEYEEGKAERAAEKESLDYEQGKVQAGIRDAEKSLERLQAFKDADVKLYSPGQMKDFKARASVNGAMEPGEMDDYNANKLLVRRLMEQYGMGDMYDAWEWGDFDLPAELRALEEKLRMQKEELGNRLEETGFKLESIAMDSEEAEAEHQRKLNKLGHEAARRKSKALTSMKADDVKDEVEAETQKSTAAAKRAKDKSRQIREDNAGLIDVRLQSHEGEGGLKALYDRVSQRGDDAMIRRIVNELSRSGVQGKWNQRDFENYGRENLTQMVKLRGSDREFWQNRFQGLQKSNALDSQGKALEEAAKSIKEAASEHVETIGSISEDATALAEAYVEQLQEIRKLRDELSKALSTIKNMGVQARNSKR